MDKTLSFPAAVLERQEAAIKKTTEELWSNIRAAQAAGARKGVADDALRFEPRIEPETYRIPKCPKRPTCSKRLAEYHASLPPARGVAVPPPVSDALPPARGVALPPPVSDEIERLHAPPSS